MKKFCADTTIHAPVEQVWNLVSDFQSYHEWSPYFLGLRSKTGEINETGQRVRGYFKSEKMGVLMYNAHLTAIEKEKNVAWKGKMIMPLGVHAEHAITLEKLSDTQTKLIVQVEFTGFLLGFMKKRYFLRLQEGIEGLCEGAKKRIEKD